MKLLIKSIIKIIPLFFLASVIIIGCQSKGKRKAKESEMPIGFIPLEKEYRHVRYFHEGLAAVELGDKWGIIDYYYYKWRAAMKIEDKWGFIDTLGKEVIPCIYDDVYGFSEGLAAVCIEKKWGFIDKTGKQIIPCIYESCLKHYFRDGLVSVCKNNKWGLINKTGKEIVPCIHDDKEKTQIFSEGLGKVKRDDKWGFIDTSGKVVIPCIYDDVYGFSEGLAAVNIEKKWGFIDKTGKIIIPCIYEHCFDYYFENGWVTAFTDSKRFVINNEGKVFEDDEVDFSKSYIGVRYGYDGERELIEIPEEIVIPRIYDKAYDFRNGLAAVNIGGKCERYFFGGKWGFIDKTGKEIIPCIYDDVVYDGMDQDLIFAADLIKVNVGGEWKYDHGYMNFLGGKWGAIDKTGKEVIPCIYSELLFYSRDLVLVNFGGAERCNCSSKGGNKGGIFGNWWVKWLYDGKWGFVDKTGKEVIPCIYNNVEDFDGFAKVNIGGKWEESSNNSRIFRGGKWGIIDKTGKEIIPCIYSDIRHFSDDLAVVTIDNKYGVIDKTGKEVIPCIYDDIEDFSESFAFAVFKGKRGILKYPN